MFVAYLGARQVHHQAAAAPPRWIEHSCLGAQALQQAAEGAFAGRSIQQQDARFVLTGTGCRWRLIEQREVEIRPLLGKVSSCSKRADAIQLMLELLTVEVIERQCKECLAA